MSSSLIVRTATVSELPDACRLLALYRPPPRRDAQAAAYHAPLTNGTIDPAGLFVADSDGLAGAILAQMLDGAMGIVWPPGVKAEANREAIEDALVTAACDWLTSRGAKVAQWLPRSGDRDGVRPLERRGFILATMLSLWRRELGRPHVNPSPDLVFVPSHEAPEFTATLIASYDGSLDCPESVGERTPAELVAGHGQPPSPAEDAIWFVARRRDESIGVVLLARSETIGAGELSYVGVVPSSRRRGVGRELLRFALARSVEVGFHNLTLSVDVRNEPALQLYRAHGFRPFEWRDVYNHLLATRAKLF